MQHPIQYPSPIPSSFSHRRPCSLPQKPQTEISPGCPSVVLIHNHFEYHRTQNPDAQPDKVKLWRLYRKCAVRTPRGKGAHREDAPTHSTSCHGFFLKSPPDAGGGSTPRGDKEVYSWSDTSSQTLSPSLIVVASKSTRTARAAQGAGVSVSRRHRPRVLLLVSLSQSYGVTNPAPLFHHAFLAFFERFRFE